MKHIRTIIPVIVVALLVGCSSQVEKAPEEGPARGPVKREISSKPLSFLSVKGTKLFNEYGEEVHLRGCNVGGWLLMEPWIPGLDLTGSRRPARCSGQASP